LLVARWRGCVSISFHAIVGFLL